MKSPGFTLIEMMIVIAIIAIIMAIALPSLLRSRVEANEAAAVWDLKTVATAQAGFNAAKGRYASFAELTSTADGHGTAFLDSTWREGVEKAGYLFAMPTATASGYECYADPKTPGTTATRWLRVDASGLVRWNQSGRPTGTDAVIGSR